MRRLQLPSSHFNRTSTDLWTQPTCARVIDLPSEVNSAEGPGIDTEVLRVQAAKRRIVHPAALASAHENKGKRLRHLSESHGSERLT
jgi:hypothetical protein